VKADVGLSDADVANMYQYTKDICTVDGKLKAVSWQATPGLYAYRRDLPKRS
jgi:multiple sugar transport system substrate-binding protein